MNVFQNIQIRKPKRNKFDLSHEKKLSLKMGHLYPILLDEVVPGDSFRVRSEILMRLAPMLAPVMHRINVFTHYFFVPNRLVWEDWEGFITGNNAREFPKLVPQQNVNPAWMTKGTLWDYFGLPIHTTGTIKQTLQVNELPFRAYQLIWNEYFRDQNLHNEVYIEKGMYNNDPEDIMTLRKRCWEKDYFTSALPWAQQGDPVEIPGNVTYLDQGIAIDTAGNPITNQLSDKIVLDALGGINRSDDGSAVAQQMNIKNLEAFGININDLRSSIKLQEWLEKQARAGSRYIETILSHFGVRSSDARLQRPEFLGGAVNPVMISEVLSTVGTDAEGIEAPQANMAGHGISVGNINGFKRSFEEHGYIIGLVSVLPKTAYQQNCERLWLKKDKLELFWPEFAHLGEQEVFAGEVYWDHYEDDNSGTNKTKNYQGFGYQSRYAEYKYKPSTVHGDFRDNLDFWHMGRKFDARPELEETFVEADPTSRIFAVTEGVDNLYMQIFHKIDALRPMPYYGTPMI